MRVAPLRIRADRLAELRRILGDDVEVTETTLTEPGMVEAIAAAIVAGAVVIDVVAPPALPGLVAALGAYTLLRPLFDPHPHKPRRTATPLRRLRRPHPSRGP